MTATPCTIKSHRRRSRWWREWLQPIGAADDNRRDRELVAAYLRNPQDADALTERLRVIPRVLAIRNLRFGRPLDDHAVNDLAQDVLMLVLKKLPEFNGRGSLDAYFFRIADLEMRNRVRMMRRLRETTRELGDLDPPAASQVEFDGRALRALDSLGGAEAEAIRLRLFEHLDFDAIAKATNTTPANVKTRYYRGLARLQADLKSPREGTHAT